MPSSPTAETTRPRKSTDEGPMLWEHRPIHPAGNRSSCVDGALIRRTVNRKLTFMKPIGSAPIIWEEA
jgi:hypothetical protein